MLLTDLLFQSFFSVEIHPEVKIEIYVPKVAETISTQTSSGLTPNMQSSCWKEEFLY